MPVWLAPPVVGGGVGTLTFVRGKEQAVKEKRKRRIAGNNLHTMRAHKSKKTGGKGILWIIKGGSIQE